MVRECLIRLWMRLRLIFKRRYHLPRGMPSLDFQGHRHHQPMHQRRSPQVESAPTAPTIPSAGIPISAVTKHDVPKDHDSKLETCKACAGSGRADPDMNAAIQVLLDAQKASMASVSQEVKEEDSPKGKDGDPQKKDDRLGAFTFCEGVATDFCVVELCCNRFSELSRAAKVLGCSYLGIHDQLEVPSTCQQVLKTLRLAIAEGKKVEGKKVGRVYCIEFF